MSVMLECNLMLSIEYFSLQMSAKARKSVHGTKHCRVAHILHIYSYIYIMYKAIYIYACIAIYIMYIAIHIYVALYVCIAIYMYRISGNFRC